MKKMIYILRAAMQMRRTFCYWKPSDLKFCLETGAVLYSNYEYDGEDPGDPIEDMIEELSCWSE